MTDRSAVTDGFTVTDLQCILRIPHAVIYLNYFPILCDLW